MADFAPFPVEFLPSAMREMVVAVADSVGCETCYAAMPAIALCGSAVGGALVATPRRGWNEPPSTFTCTVADSGTAKSPSAAAFLRIANEVEDRLEDAHRQRQDDDDGARSPREYFLASDLTVERLIENLSSSPRGIFVHRDELAGWFSGLSRYRSSGSDAPAWLSMFEAGSVQYQRRTGSPRDVRVRRAAVSVSGGIQPAILKDKSFIASGLAARFLFCLTPKRCPRWSEVEVDPEIEGRFAAAVHFLRGIPFDPRVGPGRVGVEAVALPIWTGFIDEMAAAAEDLDGTPLAAALQKLGRYALRLALIHHCVKHASNGVDPGTKLMDTVSVTAGVELARWFGREADRVYDVVEEQDVDANARRLAEMIKRKGGKITSRDLSRNCSKKYSTTDSATCALDDLANTGCGSWEDVRPGKSGGRPTRVFVLGGRQNDKTDSP